MMPPSSRGSRQRPETVALAVLVLQALAPQAEGLARDRVLLRYYGRYQEQFLLTKRFPEEVCSTFLAVCVEVPVNACVQTPPEMHVPWLQRATAKEVEVSLRDLPHESSAGTYVLVTASMVVKSAHRKEENLQLWSGCDPTCTSCAHGNGTLYPVAPEALCTATAEGGVFSILHSPADGGVVHAELDCVDNLTEHYAKALAHNVPTLPVKGIMAGGGAFGFFFLLVMASSMGEAHLIQPGVIGRQALEAQFPSVPVDGQTTCVVCLGLVSGEGTQLQCSHVFHADCILDWWAHQPRQFVECPVCRQRQVLKVRKDDGGGRRPPAAELP